MTELTKAGEIINGYKATDANMCCRGFQFELGKWYEYDGELELCESGFHFCEYPSGPWAYYNFEGTRIFKCEAEYVLLSNGPGADLKHVAKKIRLVEEIEITGDWNTGDRNTGYVNTGDWNTGDRNTGYGNTGDGNTGDGNVGKYHTGCLNVGDAPFIVFGKKCDRNNFDFYMAQQLCEKLSSDDDFDPTPFLSIPNATAKKIKALHKAHIAARKEMAGEK